MNLNDVATGVSNFITEAKPFIDALEPVADAALTIYAPEAKAAVSIGEQLLQGFMDNAPKAVTLVNQITSGTPATAQQIADFSASYESDYVVSKAKLTNAIAAASKAAT